MTLLGLHFLICHVMLRIIRQVQSIPLVMPLKHREVTSSLANLPKLCILVLQALECETPPSLLSRKEQMVIACEKYFSCICRGYFCKHIRGKMWLLSFSFCHGTKSHVSWKLLELREGLSLGSGPFCTHSVTGEQG
jgi:hypothetical protein